MKFLVQEILWIYLMQKKLVLLQVVIMLTMLHRVRQHKAQMKVWSCLISILVEFWNWDWVVKVNNALLQQALQNKHQVVLSKLLFRQYHTYFKFVSDK